VHLQSADWSVDHQLEMPPESSDIICRVESIGQCQRCALVSTGLVDRKVCAVIKSDTPLKKRKTPDILEIIKHSTVIVIVPGRRIKQPGDLLTNSVDRQKSD